MTGNELLDVAAREIGYHEAANKHTKYGEWYGLDRVAWCMEFVQWCFAQAGEKLPFKTASCGAMLNWYRENDPACIVKTPEPGCIVIFDFPGGAKTDHTGLFVKLSTDGGMSAITTIDGNTSGSNQSNGGWVQQKTRKVSYARPTYIKPRCLWDWTEMQNNTEDDDMQKRYNTMQEIEEGAAWAAITVQKLIARKVITGNGVGLNLSEDMLRMLVFNDRAGLYK